MKITIFCYRFESTLHSIALHSKVLHTLTQHRKWLNVYSVPCLSAHKNKVHCWMHIRFRMKNRMCVSFAFLHVDQWTCFSLQSLGNYVKLAECGNKFAKWNVHIYDGRLKKKNWRKQQKKVRTINDWNGIVRDSLLLSSSTSIRVMRYICCDLCFINIINNTIRMISNCAQVSLLILYSVTHTQIQRVWQFYNNNNTGEQFESYIILKCGYKWWLKPFKT